MGLMVSRTLTHPVPKGMRIVARQEKGSETVLVVQMAVPIGVLDLTAQALDLAARLTGSNHLGAQLSAMAQEFIGTWGALEGAYERTTDGRTDPALARDD